MIHFCGIHEETQLTDGGECADCLSEAYEEEMDKQDQAKEQEGE